MNTSTSSANTVFVRRDNPVRRPQEAPFLPLKAVSARTVISSVWLGIALVCPAILLMALFPVTSDTHRSALKSMAHPSVVILTSIIIGPLLEELIYRGLFLQLARRYMRVWIAIVLPSAVFAATHFMKGAAVTCVAFLMGCLFAWMVVRTGSLYPGCLCHMMFNFAGFASGPLFGINSKILAHPPGSTFNHPLTELFPAWWVVACMVMAVTSFILLAREFDRCERIRKPATGATAA